jgi:D-glycero-alpha-D-manno-heptose 1-phosphate guanylyltransferase
VTADVDVVILAGGRGTRLQQILPADLPKPLAPVAGKPFLHWQFTQLARHSIRRVILSVGWQADSIRRAMGTTYLGIQIDYCEEQAPLGTGGAMRAALALARSPDVIVMNGDTYLDVDFASLLEAHRRQQERLTVCCAMVDDTGRFGRVRIQESRIVGFEEKASSAPGCINGGIYLMQRDLLSESPAGTFSFEQDFLAPRIAQLRPLAFLVAGVFVDIGVPADFERAQALFPRG